MRILFVTCHLPWPPVSGGRRREWELLRRLDGVEVDLVAVSKTPDEDRRHVARRQPDGARHVARRPANAVALARLAQGTRAATTIATLALRDALHAIGAPPP